MTKDRAADFISIDVYFIISFWWIQNGNVENNAVDTIGYKFLYICRLSFKHM